MTGLRPSARISPGVACGRSSPDVGERRAGALLFKRQRGEIGVVVAGFRDDAERALAVRGAQAGDDFRIETLERQRPGVIRRHLRGARRQPEIVVEGALDLADQGNAARDSRQQLGERRDRLVRPS